MKINYSNLNFFFLTLVILFFLPLFVIAEEEEEKIKAITDQLQVITKDIKTLEKAIYKSSDVNTTRNSITSSSSSGLNEEILTRHLLKLNEIEEQFRSLTNRFEEVNFKLDKLSNRVTKIQSDSQLRFSDLETGKSYETSKLNKVKKKKTKLNYLALKNLKTLVRHQDMI